MGFLLRIALQLKAALLKWLTFVQEANIQPNWLLLGGVLFGLTVWLGSGCWASSIAESRRRNATLHFALGLLLPVVYPLTILLAMGIPQDKRSDADVQDEQETINEEAAEAEAAEAARKLEQTLPFGPSYFKKQAKAENSALKLTYDGTTVSVRRVLDALPEVAVVEVENGDGDTRRIRIPYAKIENCQPG